MRSSELKKAIEFHGHLGPYLVLGLLMGDLAVRKLKCKRHFGIAAVIKGATKRPKSCLIDGVQLSTGCTYGKGNIRKIPAGKIEGIFRDSENKKEIRIGLKSSLTARLDNLKGHKDSEAFAKKLAKEAIEKLFDLK